jgi:hypothetical protein
MTELILTAIAIFAAMYGTWVLCLWILPDYSQED